MFSFPYSSSRIISLIKITIKIIIAAHKFNTYKTLSKMQELCESVKMLVTQSYPTLCDPMDCSLPGSSVHGILQARILEWVAIPFSYHLLEFALIHALSQWYYLTISSSATLFSFCLQSFPASGSFLTYDKHDLLLLVTLTVNNCDYGMYFCCDRINFSASVLWKPWQSSG